MIPSVQNFSSILITTTTFINTLFITNTTFITKLLSLPLRLPLSLHSKLPTQITIK